MTSLNVNNSYSDWLKEVKERIKVARVKVALAANNALIAFYWDLGKMISETQTAYGTGFLEQLSKDLSKEFPDMKGFSYRNLAMCRQFYQFYSSVNQIRITKGYHKIVSNYLVIKKPPLKSIHIKSHGGIMF